MARLFPPRSLRERIKFFFEDHPLVRDFLIGFGIGLGIVAGVVALGAGGFIALPAVGVALGIYAAITFCMGIFASAIGAIKRHVSGSEFEYTQISDEFRLESESDTEVTLLDDPVVTFKKTNNSAMTKVLVAAEPPLPTEEKIALIKRQLEEDDERKEREAEIRKQQEALQKIAEEKAAEKAKEVNARQLARGIVAILTKDESDKTYINNLYDRFKDGDSFYEYYREPGKSPMRHIEDKCKKHISDQEYEMVAAKFAEFRAVIDGTPQPSAEPAVKFGML